MNNNQERHRMIFTTREIQLPMKVYLIFYFICVPNTFSFVLADLESHTELDNDYYLFNYSSSEVNGSESDADEDEELIQIIDLIRSANLDKSNTDRLLALLNNIHSNVGLPKSGRELWKRAGVEFTFKTNIYCSICDRQLSKFADKCSCFNGNHNMNTELLLFSIPDEIRRVVKINFDLIEFFDDYRNEFMYDITNGMSHASY